MERAALRAEQGGVMRIGYVANGTGEQTLCMYDNKIATMKF